MNPSCVTNLSLKLLMLAVNSAFVFSCKCPDGYEGRNCEVNTDDCANSPCINNGTCIDLVAGYKCICRVLYTGNHCESSELTFRIGTCLNNFM
jgi:hypothetical protein